MNTVFKVTVSALCTSLARIHHAGASGELAPPYNDVVRVVLQQHAQMTDYLRIPLFVLTIFFNLAGFLTAGALFHRLDHEKRMEQIQSWKKAPFGFCRDFIRFYESLVVITLFARPLTELEKPNGVI